MRAILFGISFFCGMFSVCGCIFADTIVLDDGTSFEGTIVEKTPEHIVINKDGLTLRYPPDTILLVRAAGATKAIEPSQQNQKQILSLRDDFVGGLAQKINSGDIAGAKLELAKLQQKPNDLVSDRTQTIIDDLDKGRISRENAFMLLQGISYHLQGDTQSAIKTYYSVLKSDPSYGQVYALLAESFKVIGQAGVAMFYQARFADMLPVS